ncbi:rho-related GTP-binding protein RhoD isoform X1 [Struthio camelus]|uniref:rho-related GTP-binding protein RhoD isoform X1 n=1 Tax=Struthio camelus TaxID=8801 RepID=UPI003603EBC3
MAPYIAAETWGSPSKPRQRLRGPRKPDRLGQTPAPWKGAPVRAAGPPRRVPPDAAGAQGAQPGPGSPGRGQGDGDQSCHRRGRGLWEDIAAHGLCQRGLPQGQEDYDRLRPLSYLDANVILMCFDVTNPSSYDNILTKWCPEVNHFCKGVPVVLVGCKTDLRKDRAVLHRLHEDRLEPITFQQGEAMARLVHAAFYFECSAKYQENISAIFVAACKAALSTVRRTQRRRRPKRDCVLC